MREYMLAMPFKGNSKNYIYEKFYFGHVEDIVFPFGGMFYACLIDKHYGMVRGSLQFRLPDPGCRLLVYGVLPNQGLSYGFRQ